MLMSRLRAAGLRPYPAASFADTDAPDPLIVDLASAPPEFARLCALATAPARMRPLIILSPPAHAGPCTPGALRLMRDEDITSLRSRLMAEARRRARQREAIIRRETTTDLGATPPETAGAPALLYLGECSASFLALQKSLKELGVELSAALSPQTARQHIAHRRFTAALADLSLAQSPGMHRWITLEDGLRGLPLILTDTAGAARTSDQLTLIAHSSTLLDHPQCETTLADAVHAESQRLHAAAPMMPLPGLALAVTDIVSGLFNRSFFEAHLPRQMVVATAEAEPLCVLVLRLGVANARSRPAQKAAGDMILRHIRETDCAALIQPGVFAISLPATPYRGGVRLAERITEAIDRAGDPMPDLSWRVTERRSYHNARTLLAASLIGPYIRTRIAA